MRKQKIFQVMLRSAGGYGLGFALGGLLIFFLFNNPVLGAFVGLIRPLQLFLKLIFAIVLIFAFVGLGGGVGGALGGWTLGGSQDAIPRRRFVWRSALAFFITHAVLIIPFLAATAVIGFLNPDIDVRLGRLPLLFGVYGLVYGALAGLLLGWLTVGLLRTLRIFLASIIGFGVGGILLGLSLYFYNQLQSPGQFVGLLTLVGMLFLFGAAGGEGLGFAYQYVHEQRSIFPNTRSWRILKYVVVAIIAIVFLSAAGKLIRTLTIRPATLASMQPLPTVGSHWLPASVDSLTNGIAVVDNGRSLTASCEASGQIDVTVDDTAVASLTDTNCMSQPAIVEGANGQLHLIWYSDTATKVTGAPSSGNFLYESLLDESGWSEPAIIARPAGEALPTAATVDGTLYLNWQDNNGEHLLTQVDYNCEDVALTNIGQTVFDVVRQEKFRPASDPIPFCQNQFLQVLRTPNPTAPTSNEPNTPNGAFDWVAEMVENAEYEVLFTTMQWDKPSEAGSPGLTLTESVATLYERVKANPEDYPRGMTVRILLGNVPDLAIFEPTNQITHVLQDLRTAGVTEMRNDEIGWNLEVANFDGAWPHAHSKFVVVDGNEAAAAGFNYSYLHLPVEHPSGQGLDMTDMGIHFNGPVAQSVLTAYDDLWAGSDQINCSTFPPPLPRFSFLWCDVSTAEASHPPEVLRFYPTEGDDNAFALNHTSAFLESDEAIIAAILAAEETIDINEVNFSLDTICVAAILLTDLCSEGDVAPPYMQALLTAVTENDIQVRVISETSAMNGLENRMAIRWMQNELDKIGKRDNMQLKFSDNKMHDKAFLIDGEFLTVGSQNFHWSAWEAPSLTEYNIATENQQAIADFQQEFEYQWRIGTPVEEQMGPEQDN